MSAVIHACALLARSFESGMPHAPNHAMLGVDQDHAREATVAAKREYDSLREQLAAANALLERCQKAVSPVSLLGRDLDAHIAAQSSTAPLSPTWPREWSQPATAPARTEAEQRVLDAMANVPEHELRWHAAPTTPMMHPCRAELARREAK